MADIESPPPPPLGLDTPPPLPPDFDTPPPPPPPGFEAIEEEGKWGVDELEIQSFDDTLTSLEQMNEEEIVEEINVDSVESTQDGMPLWIKHLQRRGTNNWNPMEEKALSHLYLVIFGLQPK